MARPLDGIRILDLSSVVMGPWATHVLADYGADVILVEPPGGDIMRRASAQRHDRMGAVFMHGARGKRSIVLDLKTERGRDALLALVGTADVFVHNVRRAAMERLRLTYDAVARVNPRIVYASLVGYGQDGPYAARPAYDDLIQGASGLAATFAMAGDEPRYVPALVVDRTAGIVAASAILAALVERSRTGTGRALEVPMFETMVELVLADHLGGDSFVPPEGNAGYARILARNRKPSRTTDGYVCVLLYNEAHWKRFFEVCGESERYRDDARLHDPQARVLDYDGAYGEVARVLATRSPAEWLATLEAADIPVMPLYDVAQLQRDPHLQSVGFFEEIEHPTEGRLRTLGFPVTFAGTDRGTRGVAPRLGEHTRAVLLEAGLTDTDVDALSPGA
ncbi:MAG: CoA transferase [Candidatus Eremiobacteraeota bacterium]|nr:CoA transferase [Candidatus Eremiobacteraeota bacterium]